VTFLDFNSPSLNQGIEEDLSQNAKHDGLNLIFIMSIFATPQIEAVTADQWGKVGCRQNFGSGGSGGPVFQCTGDFLLQ